MYVDGWVGVYVDGQMGRCMYMDGWVGVYVCRWMGRCACTWMDGVCMFTDNCISRQFRPDGLMHRHRRGKKGGREEDLRTDSQ